MYLNIRIFITLCTKPWSLSTKVNIYNFNCLLINWMSIIFVAEYSISHWVQEVFPFWSHQFYWKYMCCLLKQQIMAGHNRSYKEQVKRRENLDVESQRVWKSLKQRKELLHRECICRKLNFEKLLQERLWL